MSDRSRAPVVHLELHTGDLAEARSLLADVCGWRAETLHACGGPYHALDLGRHLGGGLVECNTRRSLWLPYVEVGSVDAATDRAREHGAHVLLEPRDGPAGRRSVIATSAGAELALWRPR